MRGCAPTLEALGELRRTAGVREKPGLPASHRPGGGAEDRQPQGPRGALGHGGPVLDRVFADFDSSRAVEGKKTEQDIEKCAREIRTALAAIEARVPEMEEKLKQGLRERFRDLLGEGVDESRILDGNRRAAHARDINEEVQRMKAHLESLAEALGRAGPQGKRLDFVCQELGREINTIGSKSMALEIDQAVIAVKDSLEKIREQLRNVE